MTGGIVSADGTAEEFKQEGCRLFPSCFLSLSFFFFKYGGSVCHIRKRKRQPFFGFPCYARIEETIERDVEIKDLPHYRSGADDGGKKGGRRDLCL